MNKLILLLSYIFWQSILFCTISILIEYNYYWYQSYNVLIKECEENHRPLPGTNIYPKLFIRDFTASEKNEIWMNAIFFSPYSIFMISLVMITTLAKIKISRRKKKLEK